MVLVNRVRPDFEYNTSESDIPYRVDNISLGCVARICTISTVFETWYEVNIDNHWADVDETDIEPVFIK